MEVDFFEEDGQNTLLLDREDVSFGIHVYPESKRYRSKMSMKEDVYYRTQEFEYRISANPIRVEVRLIERLDEPPREYMVKDGVVLESDIENHIEEFIPRLKKEVEWHEAWIGDPVSMYVLSKHPDIISPDEYRRYLRQLFEKIKVANTKVKKYLETDKTGMRVTDEWGSERDIWYTKAEQKEMSKKETDEAIEHVEKIKKHLFSEESRGYVGISEDEFRSSKEILENIEIFLNKKPATKNKEIVEKNSLGVWFGVFIIQWVWLLVVVSIALWLLSLVISVLQYSFMFTFFSSGILAFFVTLIRHKRLSSISH